MTEPASLAAWQEALREGERLDDLEYEGRRIIQHMEEARFSLDAVLLARFVQPKQGERILELGTGTGVISLLLAREGLEIEAVELAPRMAELAARNVRLNGLASLVHVVAGDYRKPDELMRRQVFRSSSAIRRGILWGAARLGAGRQHATK